MFQQRRQLYNISSGVSAEDSYTTLIQVFQQRRQLYNISSGVSVENSTQVLKLLNIRQAGIEVRDCFIQDCLVSGVTLFHSPTKKSLNHSQALEEAEK